MAEMLEFDPVDRIAAGAIGEPGRRAFYIQARKDGSVLTVLVEKEQVAALSERVGELLAQVALEHPEEPLEVEAALSLPAAVEEPATPMFRASVLGIGFDPERRLVVLELYEEPPSDTGKQEGHVARLFATRMQMRAMAARAQETVAAGRPPCAFCGLPVDAEGHVCPATNGHGRS